MNYAEARKLEDGSGWHFTVRNDDRIWTHECCREEVVAGLDDVERYRELGLTLTTEDRIPGPPHAPHATREEAEACFNAWRRDPEGVKLNAHMLADWTGCVVCDAPTKSLATHNDIGRSYVGTALCDEHMTVENVLAQIKDITQVIYS